MAGKRAKSGQAVRSAFGRIDLGDGDVQAPARQSRADQADPGEQAAALKYGPPAEPADGCVFCDGRWTDRAFVHDAGCIASRTTAAGVTERSRLAALRRDGLA